MSLSHCGRLYNKIYKEHKMPTYIYEILDENGEGTEVFVEKIQLMKDDPLTEITNDEGQTFKVRRVITGGAGTIFKGGGWTINFGDRGYKGKFKSKLRERGTPVDGPNNKHEADKQFQKWVDSGGLDGIKPSMDFSKKTQTAEQQVDPKYNPHK